jgi:hypothetical protein
VNLPVWQGPSRASGATSSPFSARAYQFKTPADYAVGSAAAPITSPEAGAAIASTKRFIETITQVLSPGVAPPTVSRAQP